MKNKFIALALVTLSMTAVVSCSTNEDVTPTPIKKEATAFTSANINLESEKPNNQTGKSVQRGTLHAWIKDVNIKVTSLDFNYAPFTTPFELIENNNNGNGLPNYVISNVALGNNEFDVTTTTSSAELLELTSSVKTPELAMTDLKAIPPYALYGVKFNAIVGNNGQLTPNYAQTLTTQHGKICSVFSLTQQLKDLGVSARISATTSNSGGLNSIVVQGGLVGSFLWTNNNATLGQNVTFTIELLNANGSVFKTMPDVVINVAKSTAINNTYVISQSDIVAQKTMEQFTAEPWTNQDGGGTIGN